jgi:hypothetical protein
MHHKAPFFTYTKYMYRFFPIQVGKEKRRKELVTVHNSFIQEVCEGICISLFFYFVNFLKAFPWKSVIFLKKIQKISKTQQKKIQKKEDVYTWFKWVATNIYWYFDNRQISQKKKTSKKIIIFLYMVQVGSHKHKGYFDSSQIWLYKLMDVCHLSHIIKLKINK